MVRKSRENSLVPARAKGWYLFTGIYMRDAMWCFTTGWSIVCHNAVYKRLLPKSLFCVVLSAKQSKASFPYCVISTCAICVCIFSEDYNSRNNFWNSIAMFRFVQIESQQRNKAVYQNILFFNGSNLMFSSSFFSKVLLEFSQLIKFFLDFDEQENVTWTLWSPRRESKPKNISKKKFVAHLLSAPHEFLGQQLMVNFAFALNNPEIFRCRTSKQSVLCDLKVQFRCLELRILFVWRIPLEKSRQKQEGFLPGYKKKLRSE